MIRCVFKIRMDLMEQSPNKFLFWMMTINCIAFSRRLSVCFSATQKNSCSVHIIVKTSPSGSCAGSLCLPYCLTHVHGSTLRETGARSKRALTAAATFSKHSNRNPTAFLLSIFPPEHNTNTNYTHTQTHLTIRSSIRSNTAAPSYLFKPHKQHIRHHGYRYLSPDAFACDAPPREPR
jgi:hypothetical protein